MFKRKCTALTGFLLTSLIAGSSAADGVPTTQPLLYSGLLEQNGAPIPDQQILVSIVLWSHESSTASADRRCTTDAPNTAVRGGRFSVVLDASCAEAVQSYPQLWAEVTAMGTLLGRSRLHASPYALESARTDQARSAQPGSELMTTLQEILTRLTAAEHHGVCGATAPVAGDLGVPTATTSGYFVARRLCTAVSGCSSRAHMCTGQELVQQLASGHAVNRRGWYAGMIRIDGTYGGAVGVINDCDEFRTAMSGRPPAAYLGAPLWFGNQAAPNLHVNWAYCDQPNPILCCD